ncbi:MAG TPA: 23S rRNA (pseudouridine(1915)-N(3))-methyltransferase RlmH [Brevundimonas sp.]|jgi:23S rRNA (pseudouridine1915-N3)-methyltransferase|uniref:23S rRNA (pseudouridine(1915)-N(3))-methyltransferase RlmH n=1 Tax=Brevundimonas sp. TaxID=1871086 RepID=UPI002C251BAD|nr:23S rRNA (pseudouridine(1915)-N(3))-methyltransferase RlmH [Brevundimonas sp.]HRH20367.1 23S rRNA (pseudouridine(1915)-N(3))-methyltransferase RlmH [Brevundimonas sp.]
MRVSIAAVGRLSRSPETELVGDYLKRAGASGKALGLTPVDLIEVEARKPGKPAEAEALAAAIGDGAFIIACDERGKALTSRALADRMATLRDRGERRLVFVIGGADGLDPAFVDRAHDTLAFGPQTWPHALVRAMLAEQVYRAVTILAGSPYHRD